MASIPVEDNMRGNFCHEPYDRQHSNSLITNERKQLSKTLFADILCFQFVLCRAYGAILCLSS